MTVSEQFIAKYGMSGAPYAAEVVAALRAGAARVSHSPHSIHAASASELLHTYEGRAKHLSRFSTPHAVQLRRDVEAFCARLKESKSSRCVAWGVECPPHFLYWFWEWESDGSFVGATKTVDDRLVSEAERIALWGERKNG